MNRRKFVTLLSTAIAAVPVLGKVVEQENKYNKFIKVQDGEVYNEGGLMVPDKYTEQVIKICEKGRYKVQVGNNTRIVNVGASPDFKEFIVNVKRAARK